MICPIGTGRGADGKVAPRRAEGRRSGRCRLMAADDRASFRRDVAAYPSPAGRVVTDHIRAPVVVDREAAPLGQAARGHRKQIYLILSATLCLNCSLVSCILLMRSTSAGL